MNHHYKTKLASLEINSHFATTINNTADSNEVVQVNIVIIQDNNVTNQPVFAGTQKVC